MPYHFSFRLFAMLAFFTALVGCSAIQDSETSVEWLAHQQRLALVSDYQAVGKLGYISPEQRESLNFQWQHNADSNQLRLSTFLGQTVLNMQSHQGSAKVETYDDQVLTDVSADRLITRLTGLTIPVEQLNDWLLGKPTHADDYTLNENQTLASLTKTIQGQTWQLEYLSYQDVTFLGSLLPVPHKLKLKQDNISINLVISKWTLK
ncbi:lipoprotein insertase outer membrane protein LolB [Vibrio renipiscarius]|uniref:Outer-membrane lipoprotein LolB n=1 Tax=Vibrio renipiscarius TaxID=1461322 RepID=A0A0C2NZB9_9VIBR|nr:lipoprotein insertase outer membrane protein LolB [Vibrio renipiscarius]KII80510.1 membrane protein [Vibrio renipiscarius]KII81440.1 membrane protein [Vibrio renipiscarius]